MSTQDLTHDGTDSSLRAEIARTLSILYYPGAVVELRAWAKERGWKKSYVGWFNDHEKLAEAVLALEAKQADIYVTMNPVKPELLARVYNDVVEADPKDIPKPQIRISSGGAGLWRISTR
jgi:hypothetical protein